MSVGIANKIKLSSVTRWIRKLDVDYINTSKPLIKKFQKQLERFWIRENDAIQAVVNDVFDEEDGEVDVVSDDNLENSDSDVVQCLSEEHEMPVGVSDEEEKDLGIAVSDDPIDHVNHNNYNELDEKHNTDDEFVRSRRLSRVMAHSDDDERVKQVQPDVVVHNTMRSRRNSKSRRRRSGSDRGYVQPVNNKRARRPAGWFSQC
jgi:hypothetical protein